MLDNQTLSADPIVHGQSQSEMSRASAEGLTWANADDRRVTTCKPSTSTPSEATRSRTPSAADFAPVRFSTWDWPERERLPRWREEFGRGMVSVDIEPVGSDLPFYAEATLQALPGVRTAFCAGSPARMNRTRALAADADDSIWLVVNLGAKATVVQRGDDIALDVGDAIPMFTDDAGILTSTDHLGILLRRAALALRVGDLDGAMLRVIPRPVEPLRLLLSYLDLIRREAALAMPALRQSVVDHIHDLAALALGANRDAQENALSAVAAARLAAVLAHIAENFAEPGLTLDAVACRLGISRRYLQQLLEGAGTSFTERVTELRLQRAFALLTEVHGRRRRISDVAMEVGFSDVSHFNRRFRARFGDTPSGVRGAGDRLTPPI
jgi:AraC-like DNA-binding protein